MCHTSEYSATCHEARISQEMGRGNGDMAYVAEVGKNTESHCLRRPRRAAYNYSPILIWNIPIEVDDNPFLIHDMGRPTYERAAGLVYLMSLTSMEN